jgi:hypothetical protein
MYLNYNNFELLSNKLQSSEDFELIEDAVGAFAGYVKDVDIGEQQIRTAYATLDGEALRERVTAIDNRRSAHHKEAIVNANLLNRLAAVNGVEAIYTGKTGEGDNLYNLEVRESVAEFCIEITAKIFENRR